MKTVTTIREGAQDVYAHAQDIKECRDLLWKGPGGAGHSAAAQQRPDDWDPSEYRFVIGFNCGLIGLGLVGILPPATSAMLHNMSALGISMKSVTDQL